MKTPIHLFNLLVLLAATGPVSAQVSYTTTCEIKNGRAYGYVHNHDQSFNLNGKVWFYFYDCQGNVLKNESLHEIETVSSERTEEIDNTFAPGNACKCSFNVDEAVAAQNSFLDHSPLQSPTQEIAYSTSCEIKNGRAHGYVHNHKSSIEIDGYVWFYFFDCEGMLLDSEDESEYEHVSAGSTEKIESTYAPTNACRCSFDIKSALKLPAPSSVEIPQPSNPGASYSTSCEIRNGRAYGYVHNYRESFTISGNVWFYFYDVNGRFLDKEDEYEYEYVGRESTEEIDNISASSNACKCKFEVRDAISE